MVELTRSQIVALSYVGRYMRATCTVCGLFTDIAQKDEFIPYREEHNGRRFLVKNNKQQLRHFIEVHYGKHKSGN